ncbi:AraC family transcriptional regulator [Klebsiella variicola]|uniref:AraC family transcriptional regulator n=1 Tax=Klebsiella variicola TaxID=244366 RepID=A0A7H4MJZ1_KLEVA|nr:AraC family transcriptional regulator [Klebsiella variicola]
MSQPGIDLTSELLRGMRLSGVNYRRIETARPFGVGFSAVAGKAQFHFISRGPVLLRMASGEQFTLESGDALFIPNGDGHALLSDPQATVVNVAQLPSETVCSTVSCINAGGRPDCPERAVIFSGCMDFELGGMQPLVKAMPEVMRVSSLLNTWPEIQPLLVAMERESLTRQVGYAGILARLGGRGGRADCPRLGRVRMLATPPVGYRSCAIPGWQKRSMPCISARGSTGKWKIWRGRRGFHARCSRNVFSPRQTPPPPAI